MTDARRAAAKTRTPDGARPSKGERTRSKIVQAALELFREHGYDATTMRAVADAAGVSLGNAYYYFRSKDELLLAFYDRLQEEEIAAAEVALDGVKGLRDRLRALILSKLDVIEPYHRFSALLFKSAADPQSPLNPFHEQSSRVRENGEQIFAEALRGGGVKVPKELADELPRILWTWSMGIVLYWIFDQTPGRARTREVAERSVDLIAEGLRTLSNPLMRPFRKRGLALLAAFAKV